MERRDVWYLTFEECATVNKVDSQTLNSMSVARNLTFAACDRVVVEAKVHWLPIWVKNDEVGVHHQSRRKKNTSFT